MMMRGRRGNTLVVVLAITLLLASQIYIVNVLSSGNFRQVEKVNSHVRAIYVGESALSKMIARLKGDSWAKRWFAAGPLEESNLPMAGGTYNSYAATVPTADGSKQADFWVRAKYEGSVVAMFSRVKYVDDTLDFHAQVYPSFFTFLPPEGGPPTAGSTTKTTIDNNIATQQGNKGRARELVEKIRGKKDFVGVGAELGLPGADAAVDVTLLPGSDKQVPQSARLADVDASLSAGLPALPALPGLIQGIVGAALGLASTLLGAGPIQQAAPDRPAQEFLGTLQDLMTRNGVPVPATGMELVMEPFYKNPDDAIKKWQEAQGYNVNNVNSKQYIEQVKKASEVAKQLLENEGPAQNGRKVVNALLDWCRQHRLNILNTGKKIRDDDPNKMDPGPKFDPSSYHTAFEAYAKFFKANIQN
jgi:hypothetical protein